MNIFRRYVKQFGSEDGAAMTEFVITLPVFVMSFVGILHLYGIQDLAIQGNSTAYARGIQHFKDIQTDWLPFDWVVSPIPGAARAVVYHSGTSSGRDIAADLVFDSVPVGAGHMMESYSRVLLAGPPSDTAKTMKIEPAKLHMTVPSVTAEIETDFGNEVKFTNDLNSDLLNMSGMSGSQGWMGFANGFLDTVGARPALAAGLRYGVAEGKFDESMTFMKRDWNVQTYQHFAAPTRPTSKWLSYAVVRMYLASDEAYDHKMLAFEMDLSTSADTQDSEDCMNQMEGITSGSFGFSEAQDAMGLLKDIRGGGACGGASASSAGGAALGFFTNILGNATGFFGGSVPTSGAKP